VVKAAQTATINVKWATKKKAPATSSLAPKGIGITVKARKRKPSGPTTGKHSSEGKATKSKHKKKAKKKKKHKRQKKSAEESAPDRNDKKTEAPTLGIADYASSSDDES